MVELTSLTVDGERKFSQLVDLNNLLVTGEGVIVLGLTAFGAWGDPKNTHSSYILSPYINQELHRGASMQSKEEGNKGNRTTLHW